MPPNFRVFKLLAILVILISVRAANASEINLVFDANNVRFDRLIGNPRAIALDHLDNLYIHDSAGTILLISPDGGPDRRINPPIEGRLGYTSVSISHMEIDLHQQIYLAGIFQTDIERGYAVLKVSLTGETQKVFDSPPRDPRGISPKIEDMEIDAKGNVVILIEDGLVFKVTPSGDVQELVNPVKGDALSVDGFTEGFIGQSLISDSSGKLYLSGTLTTIVVKNGIPAHAVTESATFELASDGTLIEIPSLPSYSINRPDDNRYRLNHPIPNKFGEAFGVKSIGPTLKDLIVLKWSLPGVNRIIMDVTGDGTGNSIAVQDTRGDFPSYTYENSGNPLVGPTSVAEDPWGNFYVAGRNSDNVFGLYRNGSVEVIIDASGDNLGNVFESPGNMEIDSNGNIYVLGSRSANIFKITSPVNDSTKITFPDTASQNANRSIADANVAYGSEEADDLMGDDGADLLFGLEGNDQLFGAGGYNYLSGGPGKDVARFDYDDGDYALSRDPLTGDTEVTFKSGESQGIVSADVEVLQFNNRSMQTDSLNYWGTSSGVPVNSTRSVFRFFNTRHRAFFYTDSAQEAEYVLQNSSVDRDNINEWQYVYQGSTFEAAHSYEGSVPLHRFYNYKTGHHFFTAKISEADYVKRHIQESGWKFIYEGPSFLVYATDPNPGFDGMEIPVYRFYSSLLNRHFYTANAKEASLILETRDWKYEGVAFYGESLQMN